jgi:maltose alpha-D-glucosyltransferase/alpha-amylase
VIVDAAVLLKFRRRLAAPAIEVELGHFLTDTVGFAHAPALLGSVVLVAGEKHTSVAVAHAFIENQGDDWTHTGAYLDRLLEEARLLPETPGKPDTPTRHAAYLNRMRQIGRRTAELHLALSSRGDIAAFAPEPATTADVDEWNERLSVAMIGMLDELSTRRDTIDGRARPWAARLLDQTEEAKARLTGLLDFVPDIDKIRCHGDLHLARTLIVKDDAFIVSFEGDPTAPPAERRRKMPAACDIATLVRSIDAAATEALGRLGTASSEDLVRLVAALEDWQKQVVDGLLEAVRETCGDSRLWPRDPREAERLIRFFIVDKAVTEIRFAIKNRPDRLHVPLAGLCRALMPMEGSAQ